jgi:polar amino acid transport system substrate-binding protein
VEKGESKGIAVDAMREIAEMQGLKVEFKDMPFPSQVPALGAGKIDLVVTGLTVTCERDKVIDFTIPWWELGFALLIRSDTDVDDDNLMCCGAKIGSQVGSTPMIWIEDELLNKGVDIEAVGYEDFTSATEDLKIGRIDAVLTDSDSGAILAEMYPEVEVGRLIYGDVPETYALAVTEDDPHGLLPKLNAGIVQLYESGKWEEIIKQYMPEAKVTKIPGYMLDCIETYKSPVPGIE